MKKKVSLTKLLERQIEINEKLWGIILKNGDESVRESIIEEIVKGKTENLNTALVLLNKITITRIENEAKAKKVKIKKASAFMAPKKPSKEMAAIVGDKNITRTEAVKRIWRYVKLNNLQDPKNKRQIICDDKLKGITGGKKIVSMFDLAAFMTNHLSEVK